MVALRPMLAVDASAALDTLTYPMLASWKLDGVRCVIGPDGPQTRSGERIPNDYVRECLEGLPPGPDGELVVLDAHGVPDFRETTGAVRRKAGQPRFRYMVFDNWGHAGPFWQRQHSLTGWLDKPSFVHVLRQTPVHSAGHVRELFAEALAEGQEGLVLRDLMGAYKFGRSTLKEGGMLKVKPFEDAEAVIMGWKERMHNTAPAERSALGRTKRANLKDAKEGTGMLGAFEVSSPRWPRTFEVSPGSFTHEECKALWRNRHRLIGKVLTFRFVTVGGYDVPRHGRAKGFREAWDMGGD